MQIKLHFHEYRYFPYEKRLALREIEAQLGAKPRLVDDSVHVEVAVEKLPLVARLTYFSKAITDSGQVIIPDQTRWEASSKKREYNNQPVNRQSTRYSLHCLHEYKGRFNPQVVRAIGNIIRLDKDALVLDPFCGSGTVLLESAHIGWNAVGLDLNPLAVMIANTKVQLFRLGPEKFHQHTQTFLSEIESLVNWVGSCEGAFTARQRLHLQKVGASHQLPSREYLERWFPQDVLLQFQAILYLIEQLPYTCIKSALRVCLSNIVREVSFQSPVDLRIRRRKDPSENYPALSLFRQEVNKIRKALGNLVSLRRLASDDTHQVAFCQDSRFRNTFAEATNNFGLFDAVITSPPYANALPYIDTQRLSLVLLDLIDAKEIMAVDRTLIGSREITKLDRQSLELALQSNEAKLPSSVYDFLVDLLHQVSQTNNGFRKQNCPSLLYKYFSNMKRVFLAVQEFLNVDAMFALIVGTNRTRINGTDMVIPTPQFLIHIAESVGFAKEHIEKLDTYHRYNIHRANSINSESLLIFRFECPVSN